jgi:putative intracellular protease/amidase
MNAPRPIRGRALTVALALLVTFAIPRAAAAAGSWVCPPCQASCDTMHFDHAGTCPQCGMALVEAASAAAQAPVGQKRVAILVFEGVQIIDFSGPYEMFGSAGCEVFTVGATKAPVTSAMGLTIVPRYTFADAPRADVIVVPGGSVKAASENEATLAWVRAASATSQQTMSVCNGAFILAHAGLLDGLTATTTSGNIDRLAREFPKTKVVRDRRYVDNGRIVTCGGLTAGVDGALHVISKLYDRGTAQEVALGEEYAWDPDGGFARAALADQQIPRIDLEPLGKWDLVSTQGTTTRWHMAFRCGSKLSATDLTARIASGFETLGKWKPAGAAKVAGTRSWTFTGNDGRPWRGQLSVRSVAGEPGHYLADMTVERAS